MAKDLELARALVHAGELALADPAVRADAHQLGALLHPDFVEVGRSGQRWRRHTIISELVARPGDGYEPADLTIEELAPEVLLARFVIRDGEGVVRSEHSSVWVPSPSGDGWSVRFHQGTPVAT